MAEIHDSRSSRLDPEGQPPSFLLIDTTDRGRASDPEPIRVVIACGDRLARAGLHALLKLETDIAVVGCACDGEQAVAMASDIRPDVLLIHMALPGTGCVEVTREVVTSADTSGVHILILSESGEDDEVLASLRAGASGFLLGDAEPADLVRAVRTVAEGEAALSPGVVRWLITELTSQPDPRLPGPKELDELTPREREVVTLVAMGLGTDEIAEHLVVTRATAKTHVSRALMKVRARDRAQLVTLAYESGLVLPKSISAARPRVTATKVVAA